METESPSTQQQQPQHFLLIFYFFLNDDYWLIAVSYPKPKVKDADLLPQCQHVACLKF